MTPQSNERLRGRLLPIAKRPFPALWGVGDMFFFDAAATFHLLVGFKTLREFAEEACKAGRSSESVNPVELVQHLTQLNRWEGQVASLSLSNTLDQITRLKSAMESSMHFADDQVSAVPGGLTYELFKDLSGDLLFRVYDDLNRQKFAYFPPAKAGLINRFTEEWAAIFDSFPESKADVQSAVEAYAADLDTACVFHLMRVAELGLRHIAKRQRLRFKREIKFENWETIFSAWDTKLKNLKIKKTSAREREIRFYSEMMLDLKAFRDAYRNHVSHAREPYDEHQAMSIYTHVRNFMARLQERERMTKQGIRKVRP